MPWLSARQCEAVRDWQREFERSFRLDDGAVRAGTSGGAPVLPVAADRERVREALARRGL